MMNMILRIDLMVLFSQRQQQIKPEEIDSEWARRVKNLLTRHRSQAEARSAQEIKPLP
jgi:hypothetical protein